MINLILYLSGHFHFLFHTAGDGARFMVSSRLLALIISVVSDPQQGDKEEQGGNLSFEDLSRTVIDIFSMLVMV